jgi:hypothetical protein
MVVKGKSINVIKEFLRINPSIINLHDKKGNATLYITTRKWCVQVYIR